MHYVNFAQTDLPPLLTEISSPDRTIARVARDQVPRYIGTASRPRGRGAAPPGTACGRTGGSGPLQGRRPAAATPFKEKLSTNNDPYQRTHLPVVNTDLMIMEIIALL